MKIVSATIYSLNIPFKEVFSHSLHSRNFSDSLIVKVIAEDGTVGYGEGLARPYVTGETNDSALDYMQNHIWPSVKQFDFPTHSV